MTGRIKHGLPAALLIAVLALPAAVLAACRPPEQASEPDATPQISTPAAPQPGDIEEEAAFWLAELESAPDDPLTHYQLGLRYLILDREKAAEHLQAAAAHDPELDSRVRRLESTLRQSNVIEDPAYQYTIIGQALASAEEWQLAETALEMAVAQDPAYAEAWAYLGEVRQQTGKENAFQALETALQLDRQSYAANLFTSFYWRRNDKPARAIPHLQTALQQNPSNLSLQEDLAATLVQAGQVETAFENINALLEESPDNPEIWRILARLSIENDLQVAQTGLPAARQAILLEPEEVQATLLLGRAYALTGDPVLAERFLLKAARQAPQLAEPHLYLGLMFLNLELYPSAQSELDTALALAEDSGDQNMVLLASQVLDQFFP
ncbi:MAG: tetratricopeptide repeat protein [Anaerolineales bacterium]|jgi:tetratricopeptide (TPR) repeat protein